MNQKVLQTLEFDKIINILTGYATTELKRSGSDTGCIDTYL